MQSARIDLRRISTDATRAGQGCRFGRRGGRLFSQLISVSFWHNWAYFWLTKFEIDWTKFEVAMAKNALSSYVFSYSLKRSRERERVTTIVLTRKPWGNVWRHSHLVRSPHMCGDHTRCLCHQGQCKLHTLNGLHLEWLTKFEIDWTKFEVAMAKNALSSYVFSYSLKRSRERERVTTIVLTRKPWGNVWRHSHLVRSPHMCGDHTRCLCHQGQSVKSPTFCHQI
eukprot:sb/3469664/